MRPINSVKGAYSFPTEYREKHAPGHKRLVSSPALNHGSGSLRKNLQIQPYGPGARVLQIETHHFVEAVPAAAFHLPQSRDAWLDFEHTPPVPHFVLPEF